jgi:hypothetical protein
MTNRQRCIVITQMMRMRRGTGMSDAVREAFLEKHKNTHILERGRQGARYLMSVGPGWIFFLAEGEPDTPNFNAIFADALDFGRVRGDIAMLVDLGHFTGNVDWPAVQQLRDGIDWNSVTRLRIAYVVRNQEFAALVKIASVIFADAHHSVFRDEAAAVNWLKLPKP